MHPQRVAQADRQFTDAFPLTSTGKVRNDVLSAQLAEEGKVPSSATS